ncbi:hypothetical protein LPJ78_001655 [Coemansia sp. RSA 989]|nr:Cullin [Coemansia mojavensis]KAJ1743327.1 hypothetical protein LPJ68_001121 [Coemansia sp. RSA 1086]KAJ1752957.1 hypothetical protein LPJ79_000779 [Coemansia sp. RSA 1821]KAJ1866704.1 hypothetical protein LPJ78_001655 [Coemansia sp. RSA 989]KAJ1875473.1 hypothetical protein LPJ55_000638 [Coemansia sp. RSA 990]KAJ2674937.1 hypothetical protein IWW42_001439 [Coemansia sp. RSA 1085]
MSFANKRPGGRILPVRRLTPQVDPQKQFEKLATAIGDIYGHKISQLSYEELYRTGYNLVLSKNGALAYDGVKGVIESHLDNCVHKNILGHVSALRTNPTLSTYEAFLWSVRVLWSEHVTAMLVIRDVLMYVDKVYVKDAQLPAVYDMGMNVFRDQVLLASHKRLCVEVTKSVLSQISSERRGEQVNRSVLRGVVDMLVELQDTDRLRTVYETSLDPQLLAESRAYYQSLAKSRLTDHSAAAYVLAAQADLDSEMDRVDAYLVPFTGTALRSVVLEELIDNHASEILAIDDAGLIELLDQRKVEVLGVLYNLYAPLPKALSTLQSRIYQHILKTGQQLAASLAPLESKQEGPQQLPESKPAASQTLTMAAKTTMALRWTQDLLLLYDIYDEFLRKSFGDTADMRQTIYDAFIEVINSNSRAAELLSLFIDDSLKNGLKRKSEQEVEHLLDRSVLMFRFLQNKDAFEHYYKLHLAKRLLLGRSLSDDAEQSLVSKLKVECGSQFTFKLEGMFKDMQLSADLAQRFKDIDRSEPLDFDLNVSVLTPTFWPQMTPSISEEDKREMNTVKPPPGPLCDSIEAFAQFYLQQRSGRRLTWQYNMGNADIKLQFGSRTYELNVSTYQMFILMLFSADDDVSMTAAEIQQQTHIPENVLARQLQSLACGKHRILTKSPMSREVSSTDLFTFNYNFKSAQYRIRLPMVSAKATIETEKEKSESMAAIGLERQYLIEAAIVRIMKARKQMMHEQLVSETINQLSARFLPTPKMVKDTIGRLIDRDYLQRSPDDLRLYKYLA